MSHGDQGVVPCKARIGAVAGNVLEQAIALKLFDARYIAENDATGGHDKNSISHRERQPGATGQYRPFGD